MAGVSRTRAKSKKICDFFRQTSLKTFHNLGSEDDVVQKYEDMAKSLGDDINADAITEAVKKGLTTVSADLQKLTTKIEEGQKTTDERLKKIEEGQKTTDERLKKIEEGQKTTNERLKKIEEGQKTTDERLKKIEAMVSKTSDQSMLHRPSLFETIPCLWKYFY